MTTAYGTFTGGSARTAGPISQAGYYTTGSSGTSTPTALSPAAALPMPCASMPDSSTVYGPNQYATDACWYKTAPNIFLDATLPVPQLPPQFTSASASNTYYGGPPPCGKDAVGSCPQVTTAAPTDPTGAPYQVAGGPGVTGTGVCPYKALPTGYPAGCPGNMSRLAWYCAFVNARLRQLGYAQRVSMMNWDAEGNGPTGLQCATFQFLYAMRQFGSEDDVLPQKYDRTGALLATPGPWTLYQNGSSNLTSAAATADPDVTPCGNWSTTDINLVGVPTSLVSTFGEMGVFQAAPEYYWLAGPNASDLGNAPTADTHYGLLPALWAAGYVGCPQSSPGKPSYDAECGCRRTVYETYGTLNDGGMHLLDVLAPAYAAMGATGGPGGTIPASTPTFSIEHIGSPADNTDFSTCINSQNFCSNLADDGRRCAANSKCGVRCGVMGAFGSWTEQCFKQFIDAFVVKYGAKSIMVYDAGFIPPTWIPAGEPNDFAPSLKCTDVTKVLPCASPGGTCTQCPPFA